VTRRVIDISHWEAPIDFAKVAADGIVAIIAKATQGSTFIDPAYAKFKRAASNVRLPSTLNSQLSTLRFLWGSYHFGTGADVNSQVEHYLTTAKPRENELVCLDFEQNPNGTTMSLDLARQFLTLFKQRTERYPVLYGGGYLKEQLKGQADELLVRCPLWIAQYASKPVLPPGWKKYVLWQYTDGQNGPEPHSVNGVGPCDRNQYNGNITQLRKLWPFR